MIQRLAHYLQGFLALVVLLVLHLIHGSTLLLTLCIHLKKNLDLPRWPSLARRRRRHHHKRESEPLLQKTGTIAHSDYELWRDSKNGIPKTLAVIFVPAARGKLSLTWSSHPWRRPVIHYKPWNEAVVVQGMAEDAGKLVGWCMELGVEELLLYDEGGLLKKNLSSVSQHLAKSVSPLSAQISSPSQSSLLVSPNETCQAVHGMAPRPLKIILLAEEDGKDFIGGDFARGVNKAVSMGYIAPEDITVDFVQEKLTGSLCPEPDLLVVLGGLHLRLRGFPPWHIRLCEIYHDSSLGLLGPPRLRYTAFKHAMDAYSGCEQRQGR